MKGLIVTALLFLLSYTAALAQGNPSAYPPVVAGHPLTFPRDTGAHPEYRTEWWYITGWLTDETGHERGFQVTFFRVRTLIGEDNPSRFAPTQLMLAHAAVADPAAGRLIHAERAERALPPLAGADSQRTHAWIGDWTLTLRDGHYYAEVHADGFDFALRFAPDGPPVLNGDAGYSRKASGPLNASYYYSRPQLSVVGALGIGDQRLEVSGHAWLDHEWSSEILPENATGWDWIGINLHGGGSLMAFRLRDRGGETLWRGGTLREGETTQVLAPEQINFTPRRRWRSPRSGVEYPVAWTVNIADRTFAIEPLMDDQELDSSRSTGALYWEGAVRLRESGAEVGQGYLEMTGYRERLNM